jgi:hypothetical protein
MSKDLIKIDKTPDGNKVIKVDKFKFFVVICENHLEICFNDNTILSTNGDLGINVNGEFSVTTNNHDLHLDSINSNIHLNSRRSKYIKDLPESIEYREQLDKEMREKERAMLEHHEHFDEYLEMLENRISELEKRLGEK